MQQLNTILTLKSLHITSIWFLSLTFCRGISEVLFSVSKPFTYLKIRVSNDAVKDSPIKSNFTYPAPLLISII